jgi:NAD-dependent SIR2 family protein deacetylase
MNDTLARALDALDRADALVITAGAGMGVDSGLPDFRGDEGFWRAYPPFGKLGLRFTELANPRWFRTDPALAWGFYGHRKNLYADTVPHNGFLRLKHFAAGLRHGAFVFTSNVDGQFHKAGFAEDKIAECHGSIHHLQCLDPRCGSGIWASAERIAVDPDTMRAAPPYPSCPRCGGLARPNVLMFGDSTWLPERSDQQEHWLSTWLAATRRRVVIELGAGTAIPTVRRFSEVAGSGTLIRVNPREPEGPSGTLSFTLGAAEALALLLPDAPTDARG